MLGADFCSSGFVISSRRRRPANWKYFTTGRISMTILEEPPSTEVICRALETQNTIVEVPARLNLKLATVLPCQNLGRSLRKGTRSLQVDGNCSKTKSSQDETKLKAGLNASLEFQCRETMEIRTKHLGQASRQASSLWKLKQTI